MPDANGAFKGSGWSASQAAGWERAFGDSNAAIQRNDLMYAADYIPRRARVFLSSEGVPTATTRDVLGDAMSDIQAARDGYNPH